MNLLKLALTPAALLACFGQAASALDAVPQSTKLVEEGVDYTRPRVSCSVIPDPFDDRAVFNSNLWPGGIVPYVFNANVTAANAAAMRHAMDLLEDCANIQFVPRASQTNYLQIQNSTGNNSFVGMVGGSQTVNIYNWNITYVMCHELMHALGQWHEQSRPDRGTYVNINAANIQSGYAHNFAIAAGSIPLGTYDFDSVMHYDACAFSTCCPTGSSCDCEAECAPIQALPPYEAFQSMMGQSSHLSVQDRAGLANRYGAIPAPTGPILQNGNPDELSTGTAPDNAAPAGAWAFPATYGFAAVAEPVGRESLFAVVPNSAINPSFTGNSLRLLNPSGTSADNFHLPNIFNKPFLAADGLSISVTFDLYVVPGFAGGAVYIGGDNGGGGFSNATDRAAQILWLANGNLVYANSANANITLLSGYATGAWINMRVVIDTGARSYNVFYGVGGGPQTQIGSALPFRATSTDSCKFYDRFTFVQFGASVPSVHSYLDNVVVRSSACSSDLNGDGSVDDSDFVLFAAAYNLLVCDDPAMAAGCPSDLNADTYVDDSDFVIFTAAYSNLLCP